MSDADKKVVWILGAGFSRSLGGPQLKDLLSVASAHKIRDLYKPEHSSKLLPLAMLYAHGAHGVPGVEPLERQWEHAEEFLERVDLANIAATGSHEMNGEGSTYKVSLLEYVTSRRRFTPGAVEFLRGQDVIHDLQVVTRWMIAAECCAFVEDADTSRERWKPYVRWASTLTPSDVVLTFNYDYVPELLTRNANVWVPSPEELNSASGQNERALIRKLHGSVDWLREPDGAIVRAKPRTPGATPQKAAIECASERMALATPGPTKYAMVSHTAGLGQLWKRAMDEIRQAGAVIFVGYRIPPTDAFTREQLIQALRNNAQRFAGLHHVRATGKKSELARYGLPVYTVLGDDINHQDPRRLRGILEAIGGIHVRPQPMFAEDFLAVYEREELFRSWHD